MSREIHDPLPVAPTPADEPDLAEDAAKDVLESQPAATPEEYAPGEPRPFEANPADVAEQAIPVPIDDDEHDRS